MYTEEMVKKEFPNLSFNHIFYINESQINNLYSQLTSNVSSKTIENNVTFGGDVKFSIPILSFLKSLFLGDTSAEAKADVSRKTSTTIEKDLAGRFNDVLKTINEKDYKDIDYLIDKYMNNEDRIFVIGKGDFQCLRGELPSYVKKGNIFKNVDRQMTEDTGKIVLFNGTIEHESNYSELFEELNPGEETTDGRRVFKNLKTPNDKEVTPRLYSRRVFMLCDKQFTVDEFGLKLNFASTYRYLGMLLKDDDVFYLIPYAVWGCDLIL